MVPIMFWRLFAPANTQAIKILEPFSPSTRLSEQHPTRSPRGYDRINPPFGDITMARFDNILGTNPPFGLTGIGGGSGIYRIRGTSFYAGVRAGF